MAERFFQTGLVPGGTGLEHLPYLSDAGIMMTPGGINLVFPGYLPNRVYPTYFQNVNGAGAVGAIDTIYLYPFFVFQNFTFTGLVTRISAAGTGSSAKAGIWANSPISNRPLGAPLAADNTGQATTTGPGQVNFSTGNFTLTAGMYWAGMKHTGTTPTLTSIANNNPWGSGITGVANSGNTPMVTTGFSFADTYSNSLPTFAEGATFTAYTALVGILGLVT